MDADDDSTVTSEDERFVTDPGSRPESTDGGWSFVAQAHYDPSEPRDLTTVIVGAIAEAEGVSITEVLSPPLYDVVDVAAMESALFGRPDVSPEGTQSGVEFRYNAYRVNVEADGWVTVSARSEEGEAEGG